MECLPGSRLYSWVFPPPLATLRDACRGDVLSGHPHLQCLIPLTPGWVSSLPLVSGHSDILLGERHSSRLDSAL